MTRTIETTALIADVENQPLYLRTIHLDTLRPDEALVEIEAVGICHADISCLNGTIPVQFPHVFGHEGAGVVKQTGSSVKGIAPGDKVLLSYNFCKKCEQCKDGHPAYCDDMLSLNFGGRRPDDSHTMWTSEGEPIHGNYFGQSSFSRVAIVNASCIVKVPPSTPLRLFAPLGCGAQTGVGAIFNALDVQKGTAVAVFGAGSVGMCAIMAARIRQAAVIVAIDVNVARLEVARSIGATHVIDGTESDLVNKVRDICGSNGVRYALDTTAIPSVIERMIMSLGTRGQAASIGAPAPDAKVSINIFDHLTKGRQYIGCIQGDSRANEMIPYLLEQHNRGCFPLEQIVEYYSMDDFSKAFDDIRSGKTIKAVLTWF